MSEELKGTNVYSPIVPGTSRDVYPTHYSIYGKGGHKEVSTIDARNAITADRLTEGCVVYVKETDKEYQYKNGEWVDYQTNFDDTVLRELIDKKVDKVGGKDLSTNDFTDADKEVIAIHSEEIDSLQDSVNDIYQRLDSTTGVQYYIRVQNNSDKSFTSQKGEPCVLNFTFISQERYSYNDPYENTGERGKCEIFIKNSVSADYTLIKTLMVNSITATKVDIAEFLANGANSIMVKITGEVTGQATPAYTYNVTMTSLSVKADTFQWWTLYSGAISIPLYISGNVNKTLKVTLEGENYAKAYEQVLGNVIYTDTALNFSIDHPEQTGVYKLSVYLENSDGTIKTKTVSFNIMCASEGEQVKLMCVNSLSDKASNWANNKLFEYAVYDGDATATSGTFSIKMDDLTVYTSEESTIPTNTKNSFSYAMEIETVDDTDFEISVAVSDNGEPLTDTMIFPVSNSSGFSATAGSVFYMNPRTRTNSQSNYQKIINEIDSSQIAAEWEGMNWNNDGWTVDSDGNRVLRMMAGSLLDIGYKPFEIESARNGKTIELDYKIYNVTDYSEPIITLSVPDGQGFTGLNIYANNIWPCSQSLKNEELQSIPTDDGVRVRIAMTISPNMYGNAGFNLCSIYINGKKNRTFLYESNDYWAQNGDIIIGSDYADVDVYGIRIYETGLGSNAVHKNYINWLPGTDEKVEESENNNLYDAMATQLDFDAIRAKMNVFVFDNIFPSYYDTVKRTGTLEILFVNRPERNVTITNVEMSGQGTSSKKYWEWNEKCKVDKTKSVITYADGSTTTKKFIMFDNVPACASVTFKKNWASSMQDHKAGSVNSYTDLYKQLGLTNEAMALDPKVRVSVYQEPFMAFRKELNDEGEIVYTCMGEFTGGPDKGDKYCFGYDTDLFPGLISIEGADNSPLPALFRVPWNTGRITYSEDEESWQYNGENSIGFDGGLPENIKYWIPAYNLAYSCSSKICPFDGTLGELNADASGYKENGVEYWIAKPGDTNLYNLYYYEAAEKQFIPSDIGEGQINLIHQLVNKGYGLSSADLVGKTNDELNTLFINARIAKFRAEAKTYFDISDAIFHHNFTEFVAATDNRAKNTYPYCFGEGCKWKWRQDDLDTIMPITNQGQLRKGYYVEVHDNYDTGASVWNGETSVFWNLLELAFPDELAAGMRSMMSAMEVLGGLKSGTHAEKVYAWYQKFYLNVKEYFPAVTVNEDSKRYENAKLMMNAGRYTNDTDPLTQELGDLYSAETAWMKKRIQYMSSKYSFGEYSANGTDSINVRAAGNAITYDIIPAIDMYPTIANGTSIVKGSRTKAGQVCRMIIDLGGTGDQQNIIQGASWLMSIGKWHDKNVNGNLIIKGRMLRELELGSRTERIIIAITGLTISDCVSLQSILLSNIATLAGSLDLSVCTHLRRVWADGTSLTQIRLPQGGCLELVQYPSTNRYLTLQNFPLLKQEGVLVDDCAGKITDFFVSDCPKLNPVDLLIKIMDAQQEQGEAHALKRVRAVFGEYTYNENGAEMLDNLGKLADGTYVGLNSSGVAGDDPRPVLDGTLHINTNCYEDTAIALRSYFNRLVLNINGEFYIRFIDKLVQTLCAKHFGDEIGISKRLMGEITELGDVFIGTEITSFTELAFTCVTSLTEEFAGCTNFDTIKLPPTLRVLNTAAFAGSKIVLDLSAFTNITDLLIDSDDIVYKMPDANSNLVRLTYNSGAGRVKAIRYSNVVLEINNRNEITDFWVEDCNTNNKLLKELQLILGEQNSLQYVRAKGFDESFSSNDILIALRSLAENGYHGINDNGERDDNIIPVLAGKLASSANYSPDLLYSLQSYFPNIQFNMTGIAFIDFKDPVVREICVQNWGSNGELTVEQAAAVTDLKTLFKGNIDITSFDELKYFTSSIANVNDKSRIGLVYGAFQGCVNLKSVTVMPNVNEFDGAVFYGCTSLEAILLPDTMEVIKNSAFEGCTSLKTANIPSGLTQTELASGIFRDCISLTSLMEIPAVVSSIGMRAFMNCSSLGGIKMLGSVPPSLGYGVFEGTTCPIYVPSGAIQTYKSAWNSLQSRIIGYNE